MKTLQKIHIYSPIRMNYEAIVTLTQHGEKFMLKILTRYEDRKWRDYTYYDSYNVALSQFVNVVTEYAEHTAYMNF